MYIHVKVRAGTKKETFEQLSETDFAISVRQEAERNLANRRIADLLALHFRIPVRNVRLVAGHRSPSKVFTITQRDTNF